MPALPGEIQIERRSHGHEEILIIEAVAKAGAEEKPAHEADTRLESESKNFRKEGWPALPKSRG
jgi:hypothetical protein